MALCRMVFARLPSLGDRRLLTRLTKLRLDNRPHLVASKICIHCFMRRSDPILGDYFLIHRPGNGIYRLGVVDGLGDPGPVFPLDSFGPCAIAGAKFTAVSKATVAPASSRVFISVLRGDSADSGIAVVSRVGRLTPARCQKIWRSTP